MQTARATWRRRGTGRIGRGVVVRCGAALACGLLGAAGCGGLPSWDWTEPLTPQNDARPGYNAFAPHSVRVFPLTRLGRDEAGEPAIVCHVELRDRWGDPVKALGQLQVQLYRPMEGIDKGTAAQILKWDVALDDERINAQSFDPATRTYRLVLVGLPAWIGERVDPPAEGENRPRARLEVRAVFQTLGPNGEERVLRDGMVLGI